MSRRIVPALLGLALALGAMPMAPVSSRRPMPQPAPVAPPARSCPADDAPPVVVPKGRGKGTRRSRKAARLRGAS